jgi:hypothetical protein
VHYHDTLVEVADECPATKGHPHLRVSAVRKIRLAAEWNAERCVHGVERPDAEAEHRRDRGG